jgi:cation/acetate symporter
VFALVAFLIGLALAERLGLSKVWVAGIFLSATLVMYAVIGVYGRTAESVEYYVAGRRIPAVYNGMATAADWMSAASFISWQEGLYLQSIPAPEGRLAVWPMCWDGLVGLSGGVAGGPSGACVCIRFPSAAVRFGGRWPRLLAALAAVLCSFT